MPSQDETLGFRRALQRARTYASQYEKVASYLDEAERCFDNECYRAAIVMLWCAASARLNEDVERLGSSGFVESDRDAEMLYVCREKIGILTEKRKNTLRRCLGDRNNCAHPSTELYEASEVVGYLQDLNQALFGYPLKISPSTFKKILLTEEPLSPEQADFLIARLRVNQRARRLPHALLDKYFEVGSRIREKIRLIWQVNPLKKREELEEQRLKERLGLSQHEQSVVMKHLARKLKESGHSHRPVEIAQLIFWEILPDNDVSGGIYEYFLSQSENLTLALLRRLHQHVPDEYKERFEMLGTMSY